MNTHLPEPYRSVELLPPADIGWCDPSRRAVLSRLVRLAAARTVIEIGSFAGQSAIFLAGLLPPGGTVYCVDPWVPFVPDSPEVREYVGDLPKRILQHFLSNVVHAGVADRVVPLRGWSHEWAPLLAVRADLVYVDGDHRAEAVEQDVRLWKPHVSPGGILCGDDWQMPSVREGLARAGLVTEHTETTWWCACAE